jgi:hypothetical protein
MELKCLNLNERSYRRRRRTSRDRRGRRVQKVCQARRHETGLRKKIKKRNGKVKIKLKYKQTDRYKQVFLEPHQLHLFKKIGSLKNLNTVCRENINQLTFVKLD